MNTMLSPNIDEDREARSLLRVLSHGPVTASMANIHSARLLERLGMATIGSGRVSVTDKGRHDDAEAVP